jgi:hypothetical protein
LNRALVLRLGAVVAAVIALLGSSAYVATYPKNPDAPLQPSVVGPALPSARQVGRIQIAPGVKATALPGITFTHVS